MGKKENLVCALLLGEIQKIGCDIDDLELAKQGRRDLEKRGKL